MKLYRSTIDRTRWFAFDSTTGWVMFPAEVAGWHKRQFAHGVNTTQLHEVPLRMGFNTGIPGTSALASSASDLQLPIVSPLSDRARRDSQVGRRKRLPHSVGRFAGGVGQALPPANRSESVRRRPLGVVDHDDFVGALGRDQLQSNP